MARRESDKSGAKSASCTTIALGRALSHTGTRGRCGVLAMVSGIVMRRCRGKEKGGGSGTREGDARDSEQRCN